MRMKSLFGAVLFAGAMAFSSAASAVEIDGIEFDLGTVFKATRIFENIVVAPGDELNGIGRVNTIENGGGIITWQNLDNGRELTFQFGGYVLEAVVFTGNVAELYFSGGWANFYSDNTPDFSANAAGGQAQDIANATDGNLWLTLVGAGTGIVCGGGGAGDPAAGTCFSGDGTAITLQSTIITQGDLATIQAGFGGGFLDVAFLGGLADGFFDTNTQPGGQDVDLNSNFSRVPGTGTNINWPLDGTADLDLFAVPEPGTLALLGIGLLGLGILARWGRKNA